MKKKSILLTLFCLLLSVSSVSAQDRSNHKGKIFLQVESAGEAWYVNPRDDKRYSLGKPDDAFLLMRKTGVGISNKDIAKIPVADENLSGKDSDGDGVSDAFEAAIGTEANNKDSDRDGYTDKEEILNGYDPKGSGRIVSEEFSEKQSGKILLQVESHGEAWYVNPGDKKRYFLGRPADAFRVMRKVGVGITDKNLAMIKESSDITLAINPISQAPIASVRNYGYGEKDYLYEMRLERYESFASRFIQGQTASDNSACLEDDSMNPVCLGAFANKKNDSSICSSYEFKNKYLLIARSHMSGDQSVIASRSTGMNSMFERCYFGFGMGLKSAESCSGLDTVSADNKNIPVYTDFAMTASGSSSRVIYKTRDLQIEPCVLGYAVAKDDISACEQAGIYKDTCYEMFATKRMDPEICKRLDDENSQKACFSFIAPYSDDIDNCQQVKSYENRSGIGVYSNFKVEEADKENPETKEVDECIADFVAKHKSIVNKDICDGIKSPNFKNNCRTTYSTRVDDPGYCTLEFLGDQSRVNSCLRAQSILQKDISLCDGIMQYHKAGTISYGHNEQCYVSYSLEMDDLDLCISKAVDDDYCLRSFGGKRGDIELCKKISDHIDKRVCTEEVAKQKNDVSLCDILSDEKPENGGWSDKESCTNGYERDADSFWDEL